MKDKAYIGDEKNIKDYLHLYLGCECAVSGISESDNQTFKLTGISYDDTQRIWWAYFENTEFGHAQVEDVWCHLRPLSDMTEEDEEATGLNATYEYGHHTFTPQEFIYFLSKGFDLFGLIDANLAIDKSTLNKQS